MDKTPRVEDLLKFDNTTVLVTGASGNIGGAIARRFAEAGARIIAHSHQNVASATDLVEALGQGDVVNADLTDAAGVEDLVASAAPDIVVNNAAVQPVQALADMSIDDWRHVLQSNLDSAFLMTQCAASYWRANMRGGSVVNIASIEGLDPAPGHAHYATSKAALLMFTRAAALEYGGDGIRVNAVSPGLIFRDGIDQEWPEGVQRWQQKAPLKRLGVSNDVADAVLFLAGPAARWITGINLVVDGGMSSQNKW
ncbi:MAG: SDR family oxidoreductase [Gammaproteobacteria bacterium]|nr:SDR family oxidoreductase [Gammaproteobacteria bacterium]NNC77346.1 SDR family oxidoreductase [Woeseiaceae bacterium]